MPIYRGGRTTYGEAIGILLLDTRFPRIPGDIGNATTFDFPVRFRVVPGATPQRIVLEGDESMLPDFVEAAKELEAAGVRAITTSCGYLSTFQETITAAVNVPVFTSSLMQVPMVTRMLPKGKKVGILTIDSRRLTEETLRSAGITDEPVVVMGSEEVPAFYDTYPRGALEIDPEKVEGAVVGMVQDLLRRNPDVAAIVCEAINYAPYAAGVQEATGLPWFDIIDLTKHVYDAVVKRRYTGYL
jgi:aspartate/glutamate racemase